MDRAMPPKNYRLVRYYSQKSSGNEFKVIADSLSRQEAERLRQAEAKNIPLGQLVVEKMGEDFKEGPG